MTRCNPLEIVGSSSISVTQECDCAHGTNSTPMRLIRLASLGNARRYGRGGRIRRPSEDMALQQERSRPISSTPQSCGSEPPFPSRMHSSLASCNRTALNSSAAAAAVLAAASRTTLTLSMLAWSSLCCAVFDSRMLSNCAVRRFSEAIACCSIRASRPSSEALTISKATASTTFPTADFEPISQESSLVSRPGLTRNRGRPSLSLPPSEAELRKMAT